MNLDRHQFSTIGGFLQEGQGGDGLGTILSQLLTTRLFALNRIHTCTAMALIASSRSSRSTNRLRRAPVASRQAATCPENVSETEQISCALTY